MRAPPLGLSSVPIALACLVSLSCVGEPRAVPSRDAAVEDSLLAMIQFRNPGWRRATNRDFAGTTSASQPEGAAEDVSLYFVRGPSGRVAFAMVRDTVFRVFVARTHGPDSPRVDEWATAWWLSRGRISWRGDTLVLAPPASGALFEIVWDDTIGRPRMLPDAAP